MDASISVRAIVANYRTNSACSDETLAAMLEVWAEEVWAPERILQACDTWERSGLPTPVIDPSLIREAALGAFGGNGVAGLEFAQERFTKASPPLIGECAYVPPMPCPVCEGTGRLPFRPWRCKACGGTGFRS